MDGLESLAGGGGAAAAVVAAVVWLTRSLIPRLQADAEKARAEFVAALQAAQKEFAAALRDERERFLEEQRRDREQLTRVVEAINALTMRVEMLGLRLGVSRSGLPPHADGVPGGVE